MEGISVTGLDKAISLCRNAPHKVREQLRRSMQEALRPVLAEAKSQAPRKTGHLADSGRLVVSGEIVSIAFGGSTAPYAGARMFAHSQGHHPDPFLNRVAGHQIPTVGRKINADFGRLIERLARG